MWSSSTALDAYAFVHLPMSALSESMSTAAHVRPRSRVDGGVSAKVVLSLGAACLR